MIKISKKILMGMVVITGIHYISIVAYSSDNEDVQFNNNEKHGGNEDMSNITQELKNLKNNLKVYFSTKGKNVLNDIEDIYRKVGDKINQTSLSTKDELLKDYEKVSRFIDSIKESTQTKQEETYNLIVDKLVEINNKIDDANNKNNDKS